MRAGIAILVAAYVLSQFFRAFLAVLAPVLGTDLGATPEDLSRASGLWFLAFAASQIPVGWALDKIGPRRTTSALLGLGGGGGTLLFAIATTPAQIQVAMILIGIGCSSVLMASFFIFARIYPAKVFATLAGLTVGIGSLGNIASSQPLALSIDAFGWRETMIGLAIITTFVAALVYIIVRDPQAPEEANQKGSLLDLLKMPALWAIFPLMIVFYAPVAGIRGLWIGPYLADIFGQDTLGIGRATLIMGLAMIAGNLIVGPLDRLLNSRKWIVFGGNVITIICLLFLIAYPTNSMVASIALMAIIGACSGTFAVMMAHGRAFLPPHLLGRGVTLLNLCGIGGAGLMQVFSGWRYDTLTQTGPATGQTYSGVFMLFAVTTFIGLIIYSTSKDRTD